MTVKEFIGTDLNKEKIPGIKVTTEPAKPIFYYLIALTIASVVGLQTWTILFNNFAVEIASLDGSQVGAIQSIREIPGFLALLSVFIMMVIREHTIAALSIICLGAGTAVTGMLPSFLGLIITTLVMSFGYHYYETVNQSLTLQYFEKKTSPLVFGRLRSLGAAAAIFTSLIIFFLNTLVSYQTLFLLLGGAVMLVGVWALFKDPTEKNLTPQRHTMVLRKEYSLYYFLTFMAGARRQIFIAFSVFLLVKVFSFTVEEITLLFILNNTINYFINPLLGKAIVRFGERRILSLEYGGLILVFLIYGFTDSKILVIIMYILDHILFNFSMAIRTYFQKIGDPGDIAPSMAVGFTINHIAAVIIPVMGGLVWMIDYRIPFVAGAVMSAISLLAVQRIPDLRED